MLRARARLAASLGREPQVSEIAAASGLDVDAVRELADAPTVAVSLNTPVGEDGLVELGDLLPDPGAADPAGEVERVVARREVREALGRLPDTQRLVIEQRYGLDEEPASLADVARRLAISEARARWLEEVGLRALARDRRLERVA